jgi:arsenite methyltransferase
MEVQMDKDDIKSAVRKGYARIAKQNSSCCASSESCCASVDFKQKGAPVGSRIGYSEEELKAVPEGANLGLGCGNPVAIASLENGQTVLDLGSGAGFDCFLAASKVGKNGKVIGIDMTPEMIEKASQNAKKGNYKNVEFRLGDIENLPVGDESIDVIISNCVINLAPDKGKVFDEAFRVLKHGGRFMVSDMVSVKEVPESIKNSIEAYVGCLGGAVMKNEYINAIREAGFQDIRIIDETSFPVDLMENDPTVQMLIKNLKVPSGTVKDIAGSFVSIKVAGVKPL